MCEGGDQLGSSILVPVRPEKMPPLFTRDYRIKCPLAVCYLSCIHTAVVLYGLGPTPMPCTTLALSLSVGLGFHRVGAVLVRLQELFSLIQTPPSGPLVDWLLLKTVAQNSGKAELGEGHYGVAARLLHRLGPTPWPGFGGKPDILMWGLPAVCTAVSRNGGAI